MAQCHENLVKRVSLGARIGCRMRPLGGFVVYRVRLDVRATVGIKRQVVTPGAGCGGILREGRLDRFSRAPGGNLRWE